MQSLTFITLLVGVTGLAACTANTISAQGALGRGQVIYTKECAQCHGVKGQGSGAASLGLGVAAPDLVGLRQRNDGAFPREFVRRFVMGQLEKDDPDAAMPDFGTVGLQHVYPDRRTGGKIMDADFDALLEYLASIQN